MSRALDQKAIENVANLKKKMFTGMGKGLDTGAKLADKGANLASRGMGSMVNVLQHKPDTISSAFKTTLHHGSSSLRYERKATDALLGGDFKDFYRYSSKSGKEMGKAVWNAGGREVAKYGAISGAIYGGLAYMTDDKTKSAGDRMFHYTKYGMAAAVDTGTSLGLSAVAAGLSTLGPMGMMAGAGLEAINLVAPFLGFDPGSIMLNTFEKLEERYDQDRNGPRFNMTQNTSMALQRQLQSLHASGSNIAESMHN